MPGVWGENGFKRKRSGSSVSTMRHPPNDPRGFDLTVSGENHPVGQAACMASIVFPDADPEPGVIGPAFAVGIDDEVEVVALFHF